MKINNLCQLFVMKLFVWDFHCTLEKGNENAVLEITNEILKKHGYSRRLSLAEHELLKGLRWQEYFAFLLPDASKETLAALELDCVSFSEAHPEIVARHISVNDGVLEILGAIAEKHQQVIISNTEPGTLNRFLELVGLKGFFPEGFAIAANSSVTNKKKRDVLKEFMAGKRFDAVVAIGDSPADLIGDINYLYARPDRNFRECEADYKIRDLREVLREL